MVRVSSGIEGFDALVSGGFPPDASVIVQGPPGQEKMAFALSFLADGLKNGGAGLAVVASQTPESLLATLRSLGVDVDAAIKERRLSIVDWYSWSEQTVIDVEERGAVIRSSVDLTSAGAAVSRAITALEGKGSSRAIIEMLSPAMNVYDLSQVYAFAQSTKRKLDRFHFTALFLLEKDMHNAAALTTLHQPFDGVVEIERTRIGDRIVRKIGILHLRDTHPISDFVPFEFNEQGLRVGLAPAPLQFAPTAEVPPSSTPGPPPAEAGGNRARLMLEIARERLKVDPEDRDALFTLAAALATADDPRGAVQALERLETIDPDYPGLYALEMKLFARLGDAEKWQRSRQKSLEAATNTEAEGATPCPYCRAPVGPGSAQCPHCMADLREETDLFRGLEDLVRATVQEMVQDELAAKPPDRSGARLEALPPKPAPVETSVCPSCHTAVAADAARCPKCQANLHEDADLLRGLEDLVRATVQEELEAKPQEVAPTGVAAGGTRRELKAAPPKPVAPAKGLTNGLILRRKSKPPAPTTRSGRTNGLRGRTNGLTNGLGRTNGLTNGLGRTNGLTNGLRGRTNGLTNGLGGRTNGLTNGLRGRTNGLTNGLGRTNGLTNGVGRTNGLTNGLGKVARSRGIFGGRSRAGWQRIGLAAALIVLVMVLPVVFLWTGPTVSYPIKVDGQFGDWSAQSLVTIPAGTTVDPNVRIVRVGVVDNIDYLAFYVEVSGTIFQGGGLAPGHMDTVRAFLDTDNSSATGYRIDGIGADRLMQVSGYNGRILESNLQEFDANRDGRDWNGWIKSTEVSAAASASRVEFEAPWLDIRQTMTPVRVTVRTQSWNGQTDSSRALLSPTAGTLALEELPTPPATLSGQGIPLLSITASALRQAVSFDSLQLQVLGTAPPNAATSLRLMDNVGNVLAQATPSSSAVVLSFVSQQIDPSSPRSYSVRGDFSSTTGETYGVRIASLAGIGVQNGIASLQTLPNSRSLGYLGVVPSGPQVDGAFSEWSSAATDATGESTTGGNSNIDLARYGALPNGTSLFLYTDMSGQILAGTSQPVQPRVVTAPSGNTSTDTDRDTVPDAIDPMPYDFNNDGVPDAQTNGDYDGDGITDYGFLGGTDYWLNTTLPANFPAPYAGNTVSMYIGPTHLPPLLGEDVLRIFLDLDNSSFSGYSIAGMGADRLIEIRGKGGDVTQAAFLSFSGSFPGEWSWTPISPVTVALGYRAVELSVPGNASSVYIEASDFWGFADSTSGTSGIPVQTSFSVAAATSVLSLPWIQDGPQTSGISIDPGSNSATTVYNQQRKVVRAGDVSGQTACDATNSDGCWYVVFYDQLAQNTFDSGPSTETVTVGTRVSGTFPADVVSSNNVSIDYREANTGSLTTVTQNPGANNATCTFTNCQNAWTSNNAYATSANQNQVLALRTFGFAVPTGAAINSVRVGIEANQTATGDDTLSGITLSWDGKGWCQNPASYAPPNTGDPGAYTYFSFTTCTGHTWVQADFTGDNVVFQGTHTKVSQPDTLYVDAVAVEVSYTPIQYTLSVRHDYSGVPAGDSVTLQVEAYHSVGENMAVQVLTPTTSTWYTRITITATTDPNTVQTYVLSTAEFNSGSPSIQFVDTVTADTAQSDLWVDQAILTTTMTRSPGTETASTGSKISGVFPTDVSTENNAYIQYLESAITFDAATTPSTDSGTTFTWSHTTTGTNRLLVVGLAILDDASQTVSSVTFNGTALTRIRADTNGVNVRTEIWYLTGPASGAHNVVVTLSASARAAIGAISLAGVNPSSALDANNGATGSSTTPSTTVTTVSDNAWVVDVVGFQDTGNPTATSGAGQTQQWSVNTHGGGTNIRGRGSTEGPMTPAGNVVMDWSLTASNPWAISAVSFKPGDSMSVRYDWSGVPAGDVHTLKVKGYRQDEDVRVEVFDPSTSSWNGRITISATSNTLYTYALTTSEYNSGSPSIRFVDALGPDPTQSNVWLDEAVMVTTTYWDRVYIMRSMDTSGSTWGSQVLLASGRTSGTPLLYNYDSAEPSIAMDSAGYLHVVWVSAASTGNQQTLNRVRYTKTTVAYPTQTQLASTASWQSVVVVDDGFPGYTPTISTDMGNRPHLAWSGSKTSGTVYYKNMFGGAWKSTVSWGTTYTGISVDVSPMNNNVNLVRYFESATNEIQYTVCKTLATNNCDTAAKFTRWDGTAGYDTVATAVESGGYPSLATTYEANGDLWIAYAKDVDGTTRGIYARFLDYPTNGFAAAETVDSLSGTQFARPTIGVDRNGNVHALYVAISGPQLYYKLRTAGGWGSQTAIDSSNDFPSLMVRGPNDSTYGTLAGAVYWTSSSSATYFVAIPEFGSILAPILGILGLVILIRRRSLGRLRNTRA